MLITFQIKQIKICIRMPSVGESLGMCELSNASGEWFSCMKQKSSSDYFIFYFLLGNTFMGIYAKAVIWECVNIFGP